ncbi:hypothetical protein CXU15_08155 [Akkermansia muciniphila]|nr:hypothetical protein CXU15_08155 [Akkermansia muciniphila]
MTDKKERGVYTLVFWLSNGMSVFSILLEHNTIPGTICPSPVKTGKNGASGRFIKTASLVKKFPAAARFPPEA